MKICEIFYSIQGEGPSAGKLATFIRLAGCNLHCHWCDSKYSWSNGKEMEVADLIQHILNNGLKGSKLVVITGGEPLLQSKEVDKLLGFIPSTYETEIETNATIFHNFAHPPTRFILSPKLHRLSPSIIEEYVKYYPKRVVFKFVVDDEIDVEKVVNIRMNYIGNRAPIYLMPRATDMDELHEKSKWLVELCKEHGFHYSPRLQIFLWGNKRGV